VLQEGGVTSLQPFARRSSAGNGGSGDKKTGRLSAGCGSGDGKRNRLSAGCSSGVWKTRRPSAGNGGNGNAKTRSPGNGMRCLWAIIWAAFFRVVEKLEARRTATE